MRNIFKILGIAILLLLIACSNEGELEKNIIKIGVTGTDGAQWDVLKSLAEEENIDIELIEFSDYTLPNNALANGDIDINSFQHVAFLSQFAKENDLDLVPIGSTVIAPLGIYTRSKS